MNHIQSIHTISYIRCENEGENQVLNNEIDPLVIPLNFEYPPIDTPQHNRSEVAAPLHQKSE